MLSSSSVASHPNRTGQPKYRSTSRRDDPRVWAKHTSSGRKLAPSQRRQAATMKATLNSLACRLLRSSALSALDPKMRRAAGFGQRIPRAGVVQRAVPHRVAHRIPQRRRRDRGIGREPGGAQVVALSQRQSEDVVAGQPGAALEELDIVPRPHPLRVVAEDAHRQSCRAQRLQHDWRFVALAVRNMADPRDRNFGHGSLTVPNGGTTCRRPLAAPQHAAKMAFLHNFVAGGRKKSGGILPI